MNPTRRSALPPLSRCLVLTLVMAVGATPPALRAQQDAQPPAPPVVSAVQPAPQPLTLDECVRVGLGRQPSLAAAQASLAAAESQRQALENMRLAALISREVPIRRQQAALGVAIAAAGVQQAECETVYAITRNYFSVMYAHQQERVIKEVLAKLKASRESAAGLLKAGDPDAKVTKIDVDKLDVQVQLIGLKLGEVAQGIGLARAALREAMGLSSDCPLELVLIDLPPPVEGLDLHQLTHLALTRRGEIVQATTAAQVTELEINAQGATFFRPTQRTFAAVSDIHARQIPQGVSNREYRPGAVGLDMPTMLAGRRHDRMQRARDLSARAAAVVDKTTNLIVLETEAHYLKWREASASARTLRQTAEQAARIADAVDRQANISKAIGEDVIRARTLQQQVQSQYNEALYLQALALAALERITAGGYCPPYRVALTARP